MESDQKNRQKKITRKPKLKNQSSMQTTKPSKLLKIHNSTKFAPTSQKSKHKFSPRKVENTNKPVNSLNVFLVSILRLGIVGVGLGTILGTILANIDLTKPLFPKINIPIPILKIIKPNSTTAKLKTPTVTPPFYPISPSEKIIEQSKSFRLTKKLTSLENKIKELEKKYPDLESGVFMIDMDNGSYVDLKGDQSFPAASTIKIPILMAFFQDVDQGKIFLDEELVKDKDVIVTGSGAIQYQKEKQKYTAIETVTAMITNSDNTATEMIIKKLGGAETLNKRFKSYGLQSTVIVNQLPDLEGTNTTSPRDLAYVLSRVNNGELVSLKSRDRILDIMQKTKTRTLLPQGLENGAVIAHKTGDIGKVLGDAGIIDIITGKRYVVAVLVKRPHNDPNARTLIQQISNQAYQHFKYYLPRPSFQKSESGIGKPKIINVQYSITHSC